MGIEGLNPGQKDPILRPFYNEGYLPAMQNVDISSFLPSQWREYRDLRLSALRESPDAFGSTHAASALIPDSKWRARLEHAMSGNDLPMVALVDAERVGLAWVTIVYPETDVAHLIQMWVKPEFRGKGVGRSLVAAAITWAREHAVRTLVLKVTCGNVPAVNLYRSMGFEPVGALAPLRPGSDLLEQTMQLSLVTDQ